LKKIIYLIVVVLLSILISGCNNSNNNAKETSVHSTAKTTSTDSKSNKTTPKKDNNYISSGPLTKVGQWSKSDVGVKDTLMGISTPEKRIILGPLKITIHDIKLLKDENIPEDTVDEIDNLLNVNIGNSINTIQIDYTIENTSNKNVGFNLIDTLTTNTKIQINGNDYIGTQSDDGRYIGKVKVDNSKIFLYQQDTFDNLNSISLLTTDVYDDDNTLTNYHTPTKIQIDLN